MTVATRNARAADRARCMELLEMLGSATGGTVDPAAGEAFDALLDGTRGRILVAEEDGSILGLASSTYNLAMRYGGEYAQLEELIVDPAARGRNVGALLVEASLADARARGCVEYSLYLVESTEHNWPFYERFGFEKAGTALLRALSPRD